MIGIILLLMNNYQKFKDTVNNIKFTTKNVSKTKDQNKKYFTDMYGHDYDIRTGHMVMEGVDKYTGHRGIIDVKTGRVVEDYIEKNIDLCTDKYLDDRFVRIKNRLDAKRDCLKKSTNRYSTQYYTANGNTYVIYWDNEVKRFIDREHTHQTERIGNASRKANDLKRMGYSEEEVYEYYCWKGENLGYPIIEPIYDFIKRG